MGGSSRVCVCLCLCLCVCVCERERGGGPVLARLDRAHKSRAYLEVQDSQNSGLVLQLELMAILQQLASSSRIDAATKHDLLQDLQSREPTRQQAATNTLYSLMRPSSSASSAAVSVNTAPATAAMPLSPAPVAAPSVFGQARVRAATAATSTVTNQASIAPPAVAQVSSSNAGSGFVPQKIVVSKAGRTRPAAVAPRQAPAHQRAYVQLVDSVRSNVVAASLQDRSLTLMKAWAFALR
jgi:hypothetical protein